jgi:ribose transport system permease protein
MNSVTREQARLPRRRSILQRFAASEEFVLVILLLVVAVVVAIFVPDARQERVPFDLLRELSPNLVAIVGTALLMIGGEFDLSVGSMIALVTVVTMGLFNKTENIWVSGAVGLLLGPAVGTIIGIMVTRLKMTSLMTTLGMMFVIRGAVYVTTNKATVLTGDTVPDAFIALYHSSVGPIPTPAILAVALIVVFYFISTQTDFGRHIYAVGGNPSASRVSGIKVNRVKFILFVLCSTTAAIAGMLVTAQIKTGYFDAGLGFELTVITAAVIGGIRLGGGQGGLIDAVLGVLILGLTNKALRLLGLDTTIQMLVTGLFMIFALWLHGARQRLMSRRAANKS